MHYKYLILAFTTLTTAVTPREPQAIPPGGNNNNALLAFLHQPFVSSVLGTAVGTYIGIKANQAWASWKCRSETTAQGLTKTLDDLIAEDPNAGSWTATWQGSDGPYKVTFSMS